MASGQKQKAKAEDVVESDHEDPTVTDDEPHGVASPSTSAQKKKKRSKVTKALDSLRGKQEIPNELVQHVLGKVREQGALGSNEATTENVREVLEHLKILDVLKGKTGIGGINKKDAGEHKFWATQPVPQPGEAPPEDDGYIEPSRPREEVRQDPYPLPKDFEWTTLDIDDPKQIKEVYDLLSLNYVEDDDAAFRFQYSSEFLRWALQPPGFHKEWHIGVRVSSNKKLVAFISGIPVHLRVRGKYFLASEINYLCVHKKLRSKRLAPVLIKEVTRQVHLKGIFQAVYTAGVVIPTPVSAARYNHRLINIPKLVDIRFCPVPRSMTLARMIRVNKVPDVTNVAGLREMEERDVPEVADLYKRYQERFTMAPQFTAEEARHQFLSGRGTGSVGDGGPGRRTGQVTWAYVAENPETHKVTDFFSFYSLPSTVIGNTKNPVLEAAYLYYYASETAFLEGAEEDGRLKQRLEALIGDSFVVGNRAKFDVFNALTVMDNVPILENLKFGLGDGVLNYYLYNWRTAPMAGVAAEGDVGPGRGIGLVML